MQGIRGVKPLRSDYNPATWMLEVSGGGAKMYTDAVHANFEQIYRDSPLCKETQARAAALAQHGREKTSPLALASAHAAPMRAQIWHVTKKMFIIYWYAN